MIPVSFWTWTPRGEAEEIWAGIVPALPRKGDVVVLSGKEFGERRDDTSTEFVVDQVTFNVEADAEGDDAAGVIVYLALQAPEFCAKCLKEPPHCPKPREDDPNVCDDCGGRIV